MTNTNWQWEDFGKTAAEWNKQFPRPMILLYSDEGWGLYCESPPGSNKLYFVPANPVVSKVIKASPLMKYDQEVEEVFYIDFRMPNGDNLQSPRLRIERIGNFLKPVPIVCGISPTQLRIALYKVVQYLEI